MATTINSSALDFENIKESLKTYLQKQDEFKDYNFEASAMSSILDVLAHNTHMNGLIANFALNESYLGTAQLRSSVVSLAEGLGYIPDTKTSSQAVVRLTLSTNDQDARISLPAYTKFTTTVNDITYSFQTIEEYFATNDGSGFYEFKTIDGSNEIRLYEGQRKIKTFIVGEYEDNPVYIIPDENLDADTATVQVFETLTGSSFATYLNLTKATSINQDSTLFILKEAPNSLFELSFGDGATFGKAPEPGNKIVMNYVSTTGAAANGALLFTPAAEYTDGVPIVVTTVSVSTGGDDKESIDRIRQNAPFQYATQNRMVTAADYSSLILRNFSTLIRDIIAWGGEDNLDPEFGAVYVSILYEADVTEQVKLTTQQSILDIVDQLAVVSFNTRFSDPIITYVEIGNFFRFNPRLSTLSLNSITTKVIDVIEKYFVDNTGEFGKSFRKSNMLTLIDDVSPAVLSNRATVKMQQRFAPQRPLAIQTIKTLANFLISDSETNTILEKLQQGKIQEAVDSLAPYATVNSVVIKSTLESLSVTNNIKLRFPTNIIVPDDDTYAITSSQFVYDGAICIIRNRLNTTVLEIANTATNQTVVSNIGSYTPTSGEVEITSFLPDSVIGDVDFIKLSCVPGNESAIEPSRNDILVLDDDLTFANGIITTSTS
jgi:hypothetical protein